MTALKWAGVILLLPFLILIALLFSLWHIGRAITLHALLLAFWSPRDRHVLFVYSNSPNWKDNCEREILPRLPHTAVILNWSERKTWPRHALATRLFHAYAGAEQFNPIGIVFRPFKPILVFRFWQPFRDARHGKPHELERLKATFLEVGRRQG